MNSICKTHLQVLSVCLYMYIHTNTINIYILLEIIPIVFFENYLMQIIFSCYMIGFFMAFWYMYIIRPYDVLHFPPYTLPVLLPLPHPNNSLCFHVSCILLSSLVSPSPSFSPLPFLSEPPVILLYSTYINF